MYKKGAAMRNEPIKKIAMVNPQGYFDPVPILGRTDTGGQVVYVLELAKALSLLGYEVDILTRWFDKEKPQVEAVPKYPEVKVVRIECGPWEFIPKEELYNHLPIMSENIVSFANRNNIQYDIFHGHYIDGGIVAHDVAHVFRKPSYFTPHSLGAWKKEQMGGDPIDMEIKYNFRLRIYAELRIFSVVNGLSVTTPLQLEKMRELYHYDPPHVEVIPPGVNMRIYKPLEEGEKPVKTKLPAKYIFCISRIDANKGHDFLLKAFDMVRKQLDDIYLVIGGGSPIPKQRETDIINNMHKIVAECGMRDRVHIIGYVPDELMKPYYQQAQLFVLPSLFEPFGMTALEAMACGTPVIASKFGGIRNVVTYGEEGILVNPKDMQEFADAMIRLLKDRDLAEKIGHKGHLLMKENFAWMQIARRFTDFYNKYRDRI
jgi:mannosylfructose-phosphate synthase